MERKDNYLEYLLKLHIGIITLILFFVHTGHLVLCVGQPLPCVTILTEQLWGSSGQNSLDTKLAFSLTS